MNLVILLVTLAISQVAYSAGIYSDENYVICDVDIKLWPTVKAQGYLDIAPDSHDPFIHCARPSQLNYVMNKYFKGTTQMILVTHASKVGSILKYENNYPHLYGKLLLKDVVFSFIKAPEADGTYSLPPVFSANELKLHCELVRQDMCVGDVRWNCSEAYAVECKVRTKRSYFKSDAEALKQKINGTVITF